MRMGNQVNGRIQLLPDNAEDRNFLEQIGEIREISRKYFSVIHFWAGDDFRFNPVCGCREGENDGQTLDRNKVTCPECLKRMG
jgi:hypothetical protein